MSSETATRWESKTNYLKEGIHKVHETKQFSDVAIIVGSQKFRAHKLILAARSTEFARLLMDYNSVSEIFVEPPLTEEGIEILLRYIYTDQVGTRDKQAIVQAYLAAVHYKQNKLKELCETLMRDWSITVNEVCQLLNVSSGVPNLERMCVDFIKRNASEVISSPHFFKLSYPSMVTVLENDALRNVKLEISIVNIVEWGRKQQKNPDDASELRYFFLENHFPLLGKIKIDELNLEEFGDIFNDKYEELLNNDEKVKFMRYYTNKKKGNINRNVLPEWCNRT